MTLSSAEKLDWGGSRAKDMHEDYWVTFQVITDDDLDGPQTVTSAPGLPTIGSFWAYGNDSVPGALCSPEVTCQTVVKKEQNLWWELKYKFTTRPRKTCATSQITNPLAQPDVISGSFINSLKRVHKRRDGTPIISSSLEPIWVNKDEHNATVNIVQTVSTLGLSTFTQMINTLNNAPLWGLSSRKIKLRSVPWKKLVWGLCTFYYQRTLQFDVKFNSFDLNDVIDVGHRVIDQSLPGYAGRYATGTGSGSPILDHTDPNNFTRSTDNRGNINKTILLDGNGEQCEDPVNHQHFIPSVELYNESNFLLLGVPVTL